MVAVLVITVSLIGPLLYIALRWLRLAPCPSHGTKEFVSKSRLGPVAHRAGKPENTLAGIREAKKEGASGVEVDLCFTKDGVPVLLHDATVDRTSNGSGLLSQLTFDEVRRLDFGYKFGAEFTCERIPTLQEALALCEELDLLVYLELKRQPTEAVEAVTKCLSESPSLYKRVAVISFFPSIIYKLRKADPHIICGMLLLGDLLALHPDGQVDGKPVWRLALSTYCDILLRWCLKVWLQNLLGVKMLLFQKDLIMHGVVDPPLYWEKRGVSIVTWTVNSKEEKAIVESELKIPYLTDCLDPNKSVPEQFKHQPLFTKWIWTP